MWWTNAANKSDCHNSHCSYEWRCLVMAKTARLRTELLIALTKAREWTSNTYRDSVRAIRLTPTSTFVRLATCSFNLTFIQQKSATQHSDYWNRGAKCMVLNWTTIQLTGPRIGLRVSLIVHVTEDALAQQGSKGRRRNSDPLRSRHSIGFHQS